jgi:PhzF family phenazine biosynthesis protein
MKTTVYIVNAFTLDGTGGNPAGIVLDADCLSKNDKQQIAARTGLSETAFVSRSDVADIKLEFFTPSRQIAHCGHATIATFAFLREQGRLAAALQSSKETIDGVRLIRFDGAKVFMEQRAPVFSEISIEEQEKVIQACGVQRGQLDAVTICNTGNAFLLLELADAGVLGQMQPDQEMVRVLSEQYGVIGFYAFVRMSDGGVDATARMFAPAYGIAEESATGMAAGPLAAYLFTRQPAASFLIEQGRYMNPSTPSLIEVQLSIEAGKICSLMAGGTATLSGTQSHTI